MRFGEVLDGWQPDGRSLQREEEYRQKTPPDSLAGPHLGVHARALSASADQASRTLAQPSLSDR